MEKGILIDIKYFIDETQKYDVKWKKPDTKDRKTFDSIYMKCPEKAKFREMESRLMTSWDWGQRVGMWIKYKWGQELLWGGLI